MFQIRKRVRHRHTALAKDLLKCGDFQPGDFCCTRDREFALAIKGDGQFQMQLRLGLDPLGLQARGEIVRYFQCHTHVVIVVQSERLATIATTTAAPALPRPS